MGEAQAPELRVGVGFDVHPFATEPTDRSLVLGGVTFGAGRALSGHSDADVVAHAIADAVLGAAGIGDIGQHFPDTEPALAGADSIDLLRRVVALAAGRGWSVANADCTVVLEEPKVSPHRVEMEARLGSALDAPVSVKATRPEGLGALGRGEGIACHAVALLVRR